MARRAGGRFLACLFVPGDDCGGEDCTGREGEFSFRVQFLRFDGATLETARPTLLGEADGSYAVPAGSWLGPTIVADSNDLLCVVYGDFFDGVYRTYTQLARIPALDDAPQSGSAGLVTWGASAAFDDFELYSLE